MSCLLLMEPIKQTPIKELASSQCVIYGTPGLLNSATSEAVDWEIPHTVGFYWQRLFVLGGSSDCDL